MIRKSIILLFVLLVISTQSEKFWAAETDGHFETALNLIELTYNKEAVYQQFIYFGILPAKERYENNPKKKEYSEIIVDLIREVLNEYFNDPETQRKLKSAYATIYAEEFSEKELAEMIAFYKTDTGKKVSLKLPAIMEKGRQKEAELGSAKLSPKYDLMIIDKLEKLQKDGLLPKKF